MNVVEWVTVAGLALLGTVAAVALLYTLGIYAAWFVVRSRIKTHRGARPFRALVVEWVAASFIFLLAIPSLFRRVVKLHDGKPGGIPVLCVHGYTQNWGNFVMMASRLAQLGTGTVYAMNVVPKFASIEQVAPQLTDALQQVLKETGAARADVVCHSMGGLILRAAMARHGADVMVRRVVTLGTPHNGTALATFGLGHNAVEMRRASSFLAGLPPLPPSLTSIWSTADAIVLPPESASCEGQEVVFDHLGHLSLLLSPKVWSAVGQALTAPEPAPHVSAVSSS